MARKSKRVLWEIMRQTRGELLVREYRIEGGRTAFGNVLTRGETRPADAFTFDSREKHWKWTRLVRQMVELPDD